MKLTKKYLQQLIRESIREASGRYSVPPSDEGGESLVVNAKNQIVATIAALTMLSADNSIPLRKIDEAIKALENISKQLKSKKD